MAKSLTGILALFFALLQFADSFSQTVTQNLPKTNFNVLSELTQSGLEEINDVITVLGKEKIYKIDIESPEKEKDFFLNILKPRFSSYNFIYEKGNGFDYRISFSGLKFAVSYTAPKSNNIIGDEYFLRTLNAGFKYSLPDSANIIRQVFKSMKDTVKVDYYDYIQESEYAFMKSELPDKGFMNKILVPAAVVAISALTAILFFTIRSK